MAAGQPKQYFFANAERTVGPVSAMRLRELAACGELQATDFIWEEGSDRRVLASKVKDLFPDRPQGWDVFISYSSRDHGVAEAVCSRLEADGLRCWIAPRDIRPGHEWAEAIIDGINACRLFVILVSASSNVSRQVLREVERAVSKGLPVIPVRVEDVALSKALEYFLSAAHWLNAYTPPFDTHLAHLSATLRGLQNPTPRPSAGPPPLPRVAPWAARLADDYREYQRQLATGRGSVVFLQQAAPSRYAEWRTAADAGDAIGMLFVGRCYQEGLVVRQDEVAALGWLEKSAAIGNAYALHGIGISHEAGRGVPVDAAKALEWYTRAAEAGNPVSMRSIGSLYAGTAIGKENLAMALRWYLQAANAGDPVGMRCVGDYYCNGHGGLTTDTTEGERWYQRAAKAGDAYTFGRLLGERLAPQFAIYLDKQASPANKARAVATLRTLANEWNQLDLSAMESGLESTQLFYHAAQLNELPSDNPARSVYDDMIRRYMNVYQIASRSERLYGMVTFSRAIESIIKRWYHAEQYDEVATFWLESCADLRFSELNLDQELCSFISELNWSVCSLFRVGQRQEAATALEVGLAVCDRSLQERPWDWYIKDAYSGLCFDVAAVWLELGERAMAQPLLRRGWTVRLRQYCREHLLDRYPELPLKGVVPVGVADEDKEFFLSFGSNANAGKSSLKKITIPVDFAGKNCPFDVYLFSSPRGYAELQDQFRWIKHFRGGEVSSKIRASFLKLNTLAVKKNVDFAELCVYALNAAKEDPANGKPVPTNEDDSAF